MIRKIKHKGLRTFWEKEDARRLNQDWVRRIHRILIALDTARIPDDMDFPGWRLHPLKGEYEGCYAVKVSGNWRIIWRFDQTGDATDVDLIDYH